MEQKTSTTIEVRLSDDTIAELAYAIANEIDYTILTAAERLQEELQAIKRMLADTDMQ